MALARYQPFPETHWSLVRRAGFGEGEVRREALTTLLSRYEPALLSYLRDARGIDEDNAHDLLQQFIADKVLEYQLLQHAERSRGRFRTLLLTSLNNFMIDRQRSNRRQPKPSVDETKLSVAHALTPPAIFDASWARSLIRAVVDNMKDECLKGGRADIWAVFDKRVLRELFDGLAPIPYEALAKDLEIGSPTQAANLLVTGKRMYARLLHAAIAEYELNEAAVREEIAELSKSLAIPELD